MIKRDLAKELKLLIKEYPVVTIIGPRQAGKTTLAKEVLKNYEYSNLEEPEEREFANSDPKAYLARFKNKVIIDEIQRVPELLSYIQVAVDKNKNSLGQFVLTGSHQLQLQQAITQSLAGRTALLKLLPFSIHEMTNASIDFENFSEYCFNGFLPRIYSQNQRPHIAYSNYFQTYVERDVKLLINIKEMSLFEKFLKLLAGRVGQLLDYSSLASDVGVDAKTIKSWLSILEASFIVFKLSPYYQNFGKRLIKSPKYYFMDTGLLCFLLGIKNAEQVSRDPLVGNIFENLVVLEFLKKAWNKGEMENIYFFRDSNGMEVDLLLENNRELVPVEIKSASTFHESFTSNIKKIQKIDKIMKKGIVVYTGDKTITSEHYKLINFKDI